MTPFNKLVQNKRIKMLILALLLTVAVLIGRSESINLTYIVRKEGEKLQPNCIAEENERYSAIGWIYPLPDQKENLPNITTKFIPTIQNDYNCNFAKRDKCNKIWAIKNWQIDENSTRTLDLILDTRWEDFPVIFTGNGGKEFEDRIEIPNVFRAGISIRASDNAELLICEGWNPYTYPCYHLNLSKTEIFLRKYMTLPKNITNGDRFLDSYKAFANILSDDEWRNFIINFDDEGVLSLNDVSVNRTVIQYQDKEALKPLYLLVRSIHPTLWKIHQNQFIYTKTPQISRLGPLVNMASKDLCISLYVSTCSNCAMSFILTKGAERKTLMTVEPTKDFEWRSVKLKDDHILAEKVNIFVKTAYVGEPPNGTDGFWAVDNVRVCHENEVKVTFLKLKDGMTEGDELVDDISCQVVQHPKWRPKKLEYSKIKDFPTINSSSNATAINLNWTLEDPNNQINYFVTYQANDLCLTAPFNLRRLKSSGFVMTKHNEITIKKLVPYTKYNITFSSTLHEKEKNIFITTSETELPTPEELPNQLQIQVTDNQAKVSWAKINCASIYGHIIYSMTITNWESNTTKELNVQTENSVEINDLEPFTTYTLYIVTARNFENIQNQRNTTGMNVNFTTKAGTAPPVQNLELYSTDKNSASFRYDLPKDAKGTPVNVQVFRCNELTYKKCKSSIGIITSCKLWPNKYCVDMYNLIPNQKYTFKISIRNDNTNKYGNDVQIDGVTNERVPGAPTNLTYEVVDCKDALDYCHLNISWLHPYNQNGTITSFDIVLNATDDGTVKNIQEVMTITNKTYLPKYEYQIQYIPYSTRYELYVQSVNAKFRSGFAHTHIKTADIGDHIDQNPVLLGTTPTSAIFKVPHLDHRLKSYTLTIIVQDFDKDQLVDPAVLNAKNVADHLCHNFGTTWILEAIKIESNDTKNITIGTEDKTNKYLEPNTQYCITFIVTNKYRNTEHEVVYYKKLKTEESPIKGDTSSSSQYSHLYILLLLLLLVPIGFLAYRCYKKRRPKPKQQENRENVYESLPFEECEENCVNNETYDQLLHK